MLKELKDYEADKTEVSAADMATLGQGVKILNNLTGPQGFFDNDGLTFRNQPRKEETILARIGASVTVSGTNTARRWTQVTPATNGTFVDVPGGQTSDDANDKDLAVPADPSTVTTGAVVILRKGYDPASGERVWGFQSGGSSTGSGLTEILITGTHSTGLYLGATLAPYTNSVTIGSGINATLSPQPATNTAVYVGNWNQLNFGSNTASGEELRLGAVYFASYKAPTNDTNRAFLYMTEASDAFLCSS